MTDAIKHTICRIDAITRMVYPFAEVESIEWFGDTIHVDTTAGRYFIDASLADTEHVVSCLRQTARYNPFPWVVLTSDPHASDSLTEQADRIFLLGYPTPVPRYRTYINTLKRLAGPSRNVIANDRPREESL